MREAHASSQGIGARVGRKEDDRLLRGRGQFVADIRLPGMKDIAFLRSPVAHARIRGISIPPAQRSSTFTAADLVGVRPIRAVSGLRGFKVSEQPPLATDKLRHVGELAAMCVGPTRAQAEDLAASVTLDLEELPAVYDMLEARKSSTVLVHEHWGDNVFLETFIDVDISKAFDAPIKVSREIRTARQCMAPIEGRGVVAFWDTRLEQLTVYSACQMPHIVRTGLSECLGLEEGQVRIIAPDVGGGFGYKGILLPEEICLGWLAMRCSHPVRWIEDRREHLIAGANCREHHYRITAYAERDGRLRGIDCEAAVDSGAYSSYPFSACLEAAQIASILPGPYDFPAYRCRTFSVATNKCPILPYRGVARTGVCFALELVLDAIAREAGIEPHEVRERNLVRPEQMPFDNITNKHFDSGDYPQSVRRAVAAIDLPDIRTRQKRAQPHARLVGLGLATYCEQAAHGTSVYYGWGIPMVPGYEQASARLTPDGGLELRVGVHSHGQGLETTIGYKPGRDSGTFSYATHAAMVAVDPETGEVEILRYVIVEDGGKLVNPMIVDGQIYGGFAQGVGTALYEEMPFDRSGQPLASTLADYLLPAATEVPAPVIDHMETLAPYTEFGVKGIGEGGAIAPPAAIANAVNDALRPLGAELLVSPITPHRIVKAITERGRS